MGIYAKVNAIKIAGIRIRLDDSNNPTGSHYARLHAYPYAVF